ncbi:MAG: family N-acetyltransferase [Rhizobacter sp.]|nr:family N-acetyltransferase [Rhizobacter sp.]
MAASENALSDTRMNSSATGAAPTNKPLPAGVVLRHADTDDELRACWPVMHQLRPHLADAADLIDRVTRMRKDSYRLLAVWRDGKAIALAGYRLQENLVYGRFLYVDDLVTLDTARGEGWGARLLDALTQTAGEAGCARLVLDTAVTNTSAQRFYTREGLDNGAMRFGKSLVQMAPA